MKRACIALTLFVCAASFAQSPGEPVPGAGATPAAKKDGDDKSKPKAAVSDTIVVTATRSERKVSELPVSTSVITQEELKNAPALAVDDLLRTVPGVDMPLSTSTNTFFGAETVSMRGLGGSRALVLVDGIPIHEPYYGNVLWQKVPLNEVRQIEVVRGANASLFGNFALGGTINMVTRPIDHSEVRADATYGTDATQRQSLTVDQVINSEVGIRVSHDRFNTNGVYRILVPGAVDVPAWNDSSRTVLRADITPSDRAGGFVRGSYGKTDLSAGTAQSYSTYKSLDVAATYHEAVGNAALVSATVFHENERLGIGNTTVAANRVSEFLSSLSDIPVHDTGGSLEWMTQHSGAFSFFSAGVDGRITDANEKRTTLNKSAAVTQQDVVGGHQRFAGVYAQTSWHPNVRTEILASARVDYFGNRGDDVTVGGGTLVYPSTSRTIFDPKIAARYQLGERSALRGSVYRAFKAPALRELYRNSQTPTSNALANPYLGPETLVGAELGYEWAGTRAHFEANVYRNEIDRMLTRVRVSSTPPVSTTKNVGKGRSQGVELLGDMKITPDLYATLGYTWSDARIIENAGDPTLVGKLIENVVPHVGTLSLRYSAGDFGIQARYRVLSRSFGEAVNLAVVPAHRVLDLSASYALNRWVTAYAIAENALNEQYYYVISTTNFRPAETRMLSWGLRVNVPTRFGR